MSSNPTVQSIVLQAIGGLHPALSGKVQSLFSDIGLLLRQSCEECLAMSWPAYRKPLLGLETKLERLLRCNLFLSDENDIYVNVNFPQNENVGNALDVKLALMNGSRIIPRCTSEVASNGAIAFSHSSDDEYWVFHPTIWINFITDAAAEDVFSPIDIGTQDPFAIDICCAVLRAFQWPHSEDKDRTTSVVEPSAAAIPFPDAVRDYLYSDMTAHLLKMFAVFVRPLNVPSIELSLRILLVFAEFLISRIPWEKQANTAAVELRALNTVFQFISGQHYFHSHPSEAHAAVFDVLDRFLADTSTSIPWKADSSVFNPGVLILFAMDACQKWHAMRPRSLQAVFNVMFDRYDSPDPFIVFHAGPTIGEALRQGSPTTLSVFRTAQCLEYFGHHGYRLGLIDIIEGYLSIFDRNSNSGIEASVVQEHIEYLHTPDILFTVCSILALGDYRYPDWYRRERIKWNILSLVRIQRDAPVWDDCRYRLGQLLEEDGMDFFYRQTRIRGIERVSLPAEKIADQRKYIRFAIETMNAIFLGTLDDEPNSSDYHAAIPDDSSISPTRASWRDHLHRLLPWHDQRESVRVD
ncbi:hypothetical protein IW261DRAFT_989327 [Armillaria novae-zelandiae]|uniref:Uncharacterized protein n=1 Tax=Armillaria novae-zelandiae TaxID=153914 RepID=A0AA39UIC8_9AGAR|nr:hypothetical protein IW261DRAFT_989327 [Armillaria novae-zelandiae]